MPLGDIIESDSEIMTKLEIAYSMGCNDKQACLFANISPQTLYRYTESHPDFQERKEHLKEVPLLNAKKNVTESLKTDVKVAQWYLERRTKEFKPPDRQGSLTLNQFNLLTDEQIRDRLAHKLSKVIEAEPVGKVNSVNAKGDNGSKQADNDDMNTDSPLEVG